MAVAVGNMRMSSNNEPNLYSFFLPKTSIVNSITTKEDADGGRRKRQRTASPVRQTLVCKNTDPESWQTQLQVAAYGERTHSDKDQETATASATAVLQHDLGDQEQLAVEGGPISGEAPEVKGLQTPPKKMLKVRPDGKLISPKSRDLTSKPIRGGKKRPTRSEVNKKQMIVILKYGTDEESRKLTAQKIEEICSAVDHEQSNKLGIMKTGPAKLEPPKPTHPFFLGSLAKTSEQQGPATELDIKDSTGCDGGQLQRGVKPSPKKIIAVNKPMAGSSTWANVSGYDEKPFGVASLRASRFPGAIAPIWPPQDMVHVGRKIEPEVNIIKVHQTSKLLRTPPKMKDAAVHIPEREECLRPYVDLVKSCREEKNKSQEFPRYGRSEIRYPVRRIMTGPELQREVRSNVLCRLPMPGNPEKLYRNDETMLSYSNSSQTPAHKAVQYVYESIAGSLSAFDKFDCETQDWVHKYAPKSAEQVLQQGREAMLLRDWLERLTVTSVETRNADAMKTKNQSTKIGPNSRRKRQKKTGDLEGFVISSDEEMDLMDELADPGLDDLSSPAESFTKRSVLRTGDLLRFSDRAGTSGRATNAVVMSGPHGCGKTAAVYAVAKELNFEVFEISAGSRRSGKDLLDKVGDMTRNHLVNRTHEQDELNVDEGDKSREDVLLISDALKQDLESGRQGTMQSFFRPNPQSEQNPKQKVHRKIPSPKSEETPRKSSIQKQSMILLEEVDILFEEDRQFWATTLELILQSKRPIIMTCTDESLLPLDDLPLHAILRFTPPPESLATDYLLLIACNEGHLVSRQAILALYRSKGYDVRASITELNFFCQMALGDTKGGLEWMLIRSCSQECQNEKGEALRVVSDGTYLEGMGWMTCKDQELGSKQWIDEQSDILGEVLEGWSLNIGDCNELIPWKFLASQGQTKKVEALKVLDALDQAFDSLSVANTYPCFEGQYNNLAVLDPTQPRLSEKSRVNFVEGSAVLQADPLVDLTGLTTSFAQALTVCTRDLFARADVQHSVAPLTKDSCINMIRDNAQRLREQYPVTRSSLSTAFNPISFSPKALSKGPYISSFDNTEAVIVEEVAPYVRSIVSYDMRLEEQRLQLDSLLSEGVRNGKRIRTTRASRAALEGGSKANTRRERWFPGSINFPMILRTGGCDWQTIALQRAKDQSSDENISPGTSRRASLSSAIESDVA